MSKAAARAATGNARVRMPEWLHARANEVAAQQRVSLNEFITRAISRAVLDDALAEGVVGVPRGAARFLVEYSFILDSEEADDFLLLARERAHGELARTGAKDIQVRTFRVLPDLG